MTHKISPTIKALPSFYAGVKFRSRLEARWARYLDLIGCKWEYEPEGYQLDCGNYCPDFLCNNRFFIEVKPNAVEGERTKQKLISLAQLTGEDVYCVVGYPSTNYQRWYMPDGGEFKVVFTKLAFDKFNEPSWNDVGLSENEPYWKQASNMRFENGVACV